MSSAWQGRWRLFWRGAGRFGHFICLNIEGRSQVTAIDSLYRGFLGKRKCLHHAIGCGVDFD